MHCTVHTYANIALKRAPLPVAGLWCVMYLAPEDAHAVFQRHTSDSRNEIDSALIAHLAPSAARQPEMDGLLPHAVEPPSAGGDNGAHLLDFFISGWHMLIRSLLIQVTALLLSGSDHARC